MSIDLISSNLSSKARASAESLGVITGFVVSDDDGSFPGAAIMAAGSIVNATITATKKVLIFFIALVFLSYL